LKEVVTGPLPPIDIVPNGIDLAAHDEQIERSRQSPPTLPITGPFILQLGRLAPVKRPELALEAVAQLKSTFLQHGLRYVFVGDGASMPLLRDGVDRHGLGEVVSLLGTRVGLEKYWLLDNARFMVSTSREEGGEPTYVMLEAMASGLPMLGSDIQPHRSGIAELGWGTLFSSGDVDSLAQAMGAMIAADLAPLRRRALACRDRYSLQSMVEGYERACGEALEVSRSRISGRGSGAHQGVSG
jgi:glycosyltransferase involved in cell wall biosynthesis